MGVISEIVPTFSHKNPYSYKAIAYSTLGIAFVGFLTWGHHMFVAGMSVFDAGAFGVLSMLVAIFSAIKVFTWVLTMRRGAIVVRTPLLYFFAFLFLFVFGGMTGVAVATESLDVHWHDTYFVVAHFHFIMVGGTLTAWLAALHYWFPKMTGRMYPERWGFLSAALIFAGFFMTFFPQFLLGNAGMPRRYYDYDPQFQPLHVISTVGSWILGAGMTFTLAYLIVALFNGPRAPANPWDSRSYEWLTPSPPPKHNFAEEPLFELGPYEYSARAPGSDRHGLSRTSAFRGSRRPPSTSRTLRDRPTRRAWGCGSSSSSEVLFFAGLFALYATYRIEHPAGFGEGVLHNTLALGSTNTAVLLVSSYTIALAVHELRRGKTRAAIALTAATIFLGLCFLGIKATEYLEHFREGIYPGGVGAVLSRTSGARNRDVLHALLLHDGTARTARHRRHVRARLAAVQGRPWADRPRRRVSPRDRRDLLAPGRRHLDLPLAALLPRPRERAMSAGSRAQHEAPGHEAEGASARGLFLTWAVLMALAALSFALRFAHLGKLGMAVALTIAAVKALLVGLVFMELAFERASIRLAFAAGLLMIVLMLALMIGDVVTRAVPPLENPPGTEQRSYG